MSRKKSFRQQTALKTTLRLTLIATGASIAGLIVLLIVVFNMMKEEQSHAESSLIFKNADVSQDTTNVLRGSINQRIIGVVVETSGKGSPVKVNSMLFNANGTSLPVEQNIENARLWYTSNDNNFLPLQQVGSTVVKISEMDFEINCNQNLKPGKNYFWLTFDIKSDAAYAPGTIDATCQEIKLGAIAYRPLISNPSGKRYTEPNIPYYSMGNFAVNNLSAWNSKRDGSGIIPKQINASRNTYFVQSGHKMISNTALNLQSMFVEKGGELRITSPLRMNAMYIAYGGIVQQDATVTDYYCFNEFYMDNGSNYIHNNTGYLPGLHCFFDSKSNQTFFQFGLATFSYNVKWGNVIIDASTPLDLDIQKNFSEIQGDLEFHKTGTSIGNNEKGFYSAESDTMHIGGSLIVSGGSFYGIRSDKFKTLFIEVGKDLIVKSGLLSDADSKKNGGNTLMKIKGDVLLMGGTLKFDNGNGSKMIFEGNGTTKWIQNPTCNVTLGNVEIRSQHDVILKGEKMGDVGPKSIIDVQTGGRLLCGLNKVTGPGNFLLQDNATLGIGHAEGISSSGSIGNIVTKGRIFHSGANYFYYTNSQPQITGVFDTRPKPNTVRRIILDKDQTSQSLALSQDFNITDEVKINKGDIRNSGHDLRLPKISDNR